MKITSKNGKRFLSISKSEWIRLGGNLGLSELFKSIGNPSKPFKKDKSGIKEEDYTVKNPLKSMPEEKIDYITPQTKPDTKVNEQETPAPKTQRTVQVEQGKAYEVVPKKDGSFVKRPLSLIGVNSPEDLEKIKLSPKGFEADTRNEIIRDKIRSVIDSFKNKQFIFISFWEKTKKNTWRHMWGQIEGKSFSGSDPKKWDRLKVKDKSIGEIREVLIDNIDYIRGMGSSYVVDRTAANAPISEKNPEGKANFVGSALAAARQALEQSKTVSGDK